MRNQDCIKEARSIKEAELKVRRNCGKSDWLVEMFYYLFFKSL